jgi:hypothetical protein
MCAYYVQELAEVSLASRLLATTRRNAPQLSSPVHKNSSLRLQPNVLRHEPLKKLKSYQS